MHTYAEEAGITKTTLKNSHDSRSADNGPVSKKIQEYSTTHKIEFNEALAKMVSSDPTILKEYRKEVEA